MDPGEAGGKPGVAPAGPRLPRITSGALVPAPHLSVPGLFYRRLPLSTFQARDSGESPTRGREGTGERPAGEEGREAEWRRPVFSGWIGALGPGLGHR